MTRASMSLGESPSSHLLFPDAGSFGEEEEDDDDEDDDDEDEEEEEEEEEDDDDDDDDESKFEWNLELIFFVDVKLEISPFKDSTSYCKEGFFATLV